MALTMDFGALLVFFEVRNSLIPRIKDY